jgi:transcriptional regulator with PAS, ATPase and Fis domain
VGDLKKLMYMGMQNVRENEHLYEPLPSTNDEPIYREGSYTIEQYRKPEIPILEEVVHDERDNPLSLEENEKELIHRALKKFNHNRKKAAQELGISERTLYRKIKQYDLN